MIGKRVKDAKQADFPFIASIAKRTETFNPGRHMICTAAVITVRDILTAEHCLTNDAWGAVQVLVGAVELWASSVYHAAWWLTFDHWASLNRKSNEYGINDICVLRLIGTVNISSYPAIGYIPYGDLKGKSVYAVGWGKIDNGTVPTRLQRTKLKILSTSECKRRASKLGQRNYDVNKNLLCSAATPFALLTCGDSGGPVTHKSQIIAVNSGTCPLPDITFHPDKLNLHTNLHNYKSFISATIEM